MRYRLKTLLAAGGFALLSSALPCLGGPAAAVEGEEPLLKREWPSNGVFGTFDRAALQRGFQVYQNVCHSCHSLDYVAFRNMELLGYNEDEIGAIAAGYTVNDGPNDDGDMFERPGRASDHFPPPFPNAKAAAAANGGKAPPDLSLITKAREEGQDYVYSLLQGYHDEAPEGVTVPDGSYYNAYYPGHVIAMPPPLSEDAVEYADGTPATIQQMSADVTQFLAFAAEPTLEQRKQTGVMVFLFLILFTGIFYAYKRRVWADVKKH
ncbi:MAG: cytochrome c1 [Geminicoccaceae bacterium]|nr:cytochrome c1 [Geminicoccaceae bacterium]